MKWAIWYRFSIVKFSPFSPSKKRIWAREREKFEKQRRQGAKRSNSPFNYSWNGWEGSSAQSSETLSHSLARCSTRFIFKLNEVKETRLKFSLSQLLSCSSVLVSVTVWNGKSAFVWLEPMSEREEKSSFKWFSNRMSSENDQINF